MLAATLRNPNRDDPASAVEVGEWQPRDAPPGWVRVRLRAASLNHHDVWSMRGLGVRAEDLPVVLGCDGAGVDEDGRDVILYPLITEGDGRIDETIDPSRRILSEGGLDGTFAEAVHVPARNLVPKPPSMPWQVAGSLGTAWLTAYRMLFSVVHLPPGCTILIQGAGGGLSTALIALAKAGGLRVWVTSRSPEKRERAVAELGADAAFEAGDRLPERADAVMDSVGEATWQHTLRCVRPGGTIVTVGTTGGAVVKTDLVRVFLQQITIRGTAMGTAEEMRRLVRMCEAHDLAPPIDSVFALADARSAIQRMVDGELFGKVVLDCA
jgi:NADPH:quinone reductase-like Zn-dependent oxidoreductase